MRIFILIAFLFIAAPAWAEDATPTATPAPATPTLAETIVSAKKGDAKAQLDLGLMYSKGQGVAQDNQEALKWYRLAAAHGNDKAQFLLAQMYFYGAQNVTKDYAEAVKWFGLSANQGNAMSQSTLGVAYSKGLGVGRDYQEAYFWFLVSSETGWEAAITGRDMTEKRLKPEQVAAVKKRAKEWKPAAPTP